MEAYGLRVEKLDYEVESDAEDKLTDDDVMALSQALMKNDVFQGPLDLSKNGLSDLVSYNFTFNRFKFSHASTSRMHLLDQALSILRSLTRPRIII